ncbi:hypothetical protein Golomagni_07573 [Golovinomyces magnicellulatus]|nr:hypothetical protein Golomagni_07573 [Golovinomyces magnicellulatus]
MSAPVIHSDTTIFGQDANAFSPERWLQSDEEQVKRMDRCLMTFGYGTRTCIGKNISLMEMGKLVPRLLREFDLEWASEKSEWQVFNYWFARQEGLICRLRQRRN